jgi:hypothetical protein
MTLISAKGIPSNCGSIVGENAPVRDFIKKKISSSKFYIDTIAHSRITSPASTSNITVQDRNVTRNTGDTLITDYEYEIKFFDVDTGIDESTLTWEISDADVATIINTSHIEGQDAGTAILKATTPSGEFAAKKLNFVLTGGTNNDEFLSYVSGSLAEHICDTIDVLIDIR